MPLEAVKVPAKPALESGDVMYKKIMGKIEPDLVLSKNELDLKYVRNGVPTETKAEMNARDKRYDTAQKEFNVQFAKYAIEKRQEMKQYRSGVLKEAEQKSKQREEQDLARLSAEMESSPATQHV